MKIRVKLAFGEKSALRLLNWLAQENARMLNLRPELPNLYDSGTVYRREEEETWSDVVNTLAEGHEDCDALAAYRAGELLARGHRAMLPWQGGYTAASRARVPRIRADVVMKTRGNKPGGLYHCIVRYWIDGQMYYDDPSLRLGMRDGHIARVVLDHWASRGVSPRVLP